MTILSLSEFDKDTQKSWQKLVSETLDKQSIPQWVELEEDVELDPFLHFSDQAKYAPLSNPSTPSRLAEYIVTSQGETKANTEILNALENGAAALIIQCTPTLQDYTSLFKNVDLSIIHVCILGEEVHFQSPGLLQYANALNGFAIVQGEMNPSLTKAYPNLNFNYLEYEGHSNTIKQLHQFLTSSLQVLKGVKDSKPKGFFTTSIIGPLYFLEIAKLRAMRILWANLLKSLSYPDLELTMLLQPKGQSVFRCTDFQLPDL